MMHHYTEVQQFSKYHLDKHSLTFWTFAVTVTLNTVIPFSHRTLRLMMLYYQTKFSCKPTSSLEDTTKIVIFWLYKPLLWPWHWIQWTNSSAWHSGLWCWITIPDLVTKCSVVQKISSGQTFPAFWTFAVTLTLNAVIPFFYRTLRLMMEYSPQWGAADTEIKIPPGENTKLKRSPFQAWSRSVYSHTCYAYCQGVLPCLFHPSSPFTCIFSKPLPIFSCVGLQNKIGHPAGCRFPCWVPAAYK